MNQNEQSLIKEIVTMLENAGYDSYAQITGYVETNNDIYITRKGSARDKIKAVSLSALKEYLHENKRSD